MIQQHKSNKSAVLLSDFPSLAAVTITEAKKKKSEAMNLVEFSSYDLNKVKDVNVLNLLKSPRERTVEELEMNKGFRSWDGAEREKRSDELRRGGGFYRFDILQEDSQSIFIFTTSDFNDF